ncbi:MAG: ribonuclease P protein component [Chitinophagales bacterium]|nr:ribonuclease P protein component [Chitinophagales bacterium]
MVNEISFPQRRQTLSRDERLRGKRQIEKLFASGKTVQVMPLRIRFCQEEGPGPPVRVLFSVSSRSFRNAVSRNRIRRLMREAYRRNKHLLTEPLQACGRHALLAVQYQHHAPSDYGSVEASMRRALTQAASGLCAS